MKNYENNAWIKWEFQKIEPIKKSSVKENKTELKISMESFNSRPHQVEARISEL